MEQIKKIREITGAGMVDCKKALDEAGGDIEKAIDLLRKKGIAKAAKRSDRETNEGVVKVSVNEAGNEGYIVELNTETDFVALNEKFQNFGDAVLKIIAEKKPTSREELLVLPMVDSTVEEMLNSLSGMIGEKLDIKKFEILSSVGTVAAYSHMGGKIGVLIALDKPNLNDLARDLAMQVAAANPRYLNPSDVPAEELEREKEIYRDQLSREGKPANIVEKILEGKVAKYFEDICLSKQLFIKDDKVKVESLLNGAVIERFVRYSL
jgi:elongation factor Ts